MGEVIDLSPAKNPDVVLEKAKGAFDACMIIGWDKEGALDVRATTDLDKADILLMLEYVKFNLLAGLYDVEK